MKNYFIIFIISQFNYLIILAQARPYIPPISPLYNSVQLVNLNFQEIDEVFPAITFLLDPNNTYMTGSTLSIDGGYSII